MVLENHHNVQQVFFLPPCEHVSGLQQEAHCISMDVWGTISCQSGNRQEWSSNSSFPPPSLPLTVINDGALCSAEPDWPRPPLAICSRPAPTFPPHPPNIPRQHHKAGSAQYKVRSICFLVAVHSWKRIMTLLISKWKFLIEMDYAVTNLTGNLSRFSFHIRNEGDTAKYEPLRRKRNSDRYKRRC